jgi:SUKH-4 immunity protein
MDLASIESALAKLPASYEPLLLRFVAKPRPATDGTVVIGSDDGTDLQVDPVSGHIQSVGTRGVLPARFVNSSIGRLAECVAAYAVYAKRVAAVEDETEARGLVQEVRATITRIDAAALESPGTWWSLVLEQAEGGLL